MTTYREHPAASSRASTSYRSPPSRVHPRAASVVPRTSRPMATRSPCSAITDAHQSGRSRAAVPMLTRVQPVARAAASVSSSRMPPDSSTSMSSAATTEVMRSRLEPRPKAASRSTRWTQRAPTRCQRSADSTAPPKTRSLPATPWTSWTARPPETSTAGRSCRALIAPSLRPGRPRLPPRSHIVPAEESHSSRRGVTCFPPRSQVLPAQSASAEQLSDPAGTNRLLRGNQPTLHRE